MSLALAVGMSAAQAESISSLPQLSKWIVHHYKCRIAHLPKSGDVGEKFFEISPKSIGHGGEDIVLKNAGDEVVASANAQMVGLTWSRAGKVITMAQAWVQNSSTKSLVLMAVDPLDQETQVHVSCDAVTFDQLSLPAGKANTK